MDVVSPSHLRAASLLWQSRPGAWTLTVVCKATYTLLPSESRLAETPDDPVESDAYWDDDERLSLRAASDLAPFKPRADVVLVGHAHAPRRQPVASLITRLVVGEVDKSIEVFGDRAWMQDGQLREGPRFTKLPLRWERAAGGPETANPVGMRAGADPDRYGMVPVPNLQPPGMHLTGPRDHVEPIGYGPIAPAWPLRRGKLYHHAGGWPYPGCFNQPLPDGIDPGYFNVAPADQQLAELRGDERILLENLHPEHPRLITSLPGGAPRATMERPGGYSDPLALRCDTLAIDADRGRCTLVWRGQVALEHTAQAGRVVFSMDMPSPRLGAVTMDPRAALRGSISMGPRPASPGPALPVSSGAPRAQTIDAASIRAMAALPFSGRAAPGQAPPPPPSAPSFDASRAPAFPFRGAPAPASEASSIWSQPAPKAVPVADTAPPAMAPPPLVRPQVTSDPIAAPTPSSVWGGGDARAGAAGLSVGQIAASQPSEAAAPASVERWSPPERSTPVSEPRPAARAERTEVIQLVWLDPEMLPRIRRKAAWRSILAELEDAAPDPETDDPVLAKEPAEIEDRRDVLAILARADAVDGDGLSAEVVAGVREDGCHVPRLVLVTGELVLPFDELEALKATMSTAAPFAGSDEALKGAIETARDFLRTPDLRSAPAVAEALTARIREAFAQGRRAVQAGYLDTQTERALLDQRCYQKRALLGATHLRGLLQVPGGALPVPAYLPEVIAKKLPLYQKFKARIIAEAHLAADQYEQHASALKVAALSRLAPAPKR